MQINYLAILVSGIVAMIIGSIWYGPLFGKKYMHEMGMDAWSSEKKAEMKKSMMMSYVWQFIASLVTFYVLARFMNATNQTDVMGGITVGFWVWFGFVLPLKFSDTLWGGKKSLFWMGALANLVTLLVVGAIIGAWR